MSGRPICRCAPTDENGTEPNPDCPLHGHPDPDYVFGASLPPLVEGSPAPVTFSVPLLDEFHRIMTQHGIASRTQMELTGDLLSFMVRIINEQAKLKAPAPGDGSFLPVEPHGSWHDDSHSREPIKVGPAPPPAADEAIEQDGISIDDPRCATWRRLVVKLEAELEFERGHSEMLSNGLHNRNASLAKAEADLTALRAAVTSVTQEMREEADAVHEGRSAYVSASDVLDWAAALDAARTGQGQG